MFHVSAGHLTRQNAMHQAPPHHVINPDRNSRDYSASAESSDSEDDSPFARALKQKKLKKTGAVNDRSAPKIPAWSMTIL